MYDFPLAAWRWDSDTTHPVYMQVQCVLLLLRLERGSKLPSWGGGEGGCSISYVDMCCCEGYGSQAVKVIPWK